MNLHCDLNFFCTHSIITYPSSRMTESVSQPLWVCQEAMSRDSRRVSFSLVGLAEVLHSQGRLDEAVKVATAAFAGFVSAGDRVFSTQRDILMIFLSALEFFTSEMCTESPQVRNQMIRVYGRILNTKFPDLIDWDGLEHPILRSCVLQHMGGGNASALADLDRKAKSWKISPPVDDSTPVPPTPRNEKKRTRMADFEYTPPSAKRSPTKLEEPLGDSIKKTRKPVHRRKVTDRILEQRKSKTIHEWLAKLRANRI